MDRHQGLLCLQLTGSNFPFLALLYVLVFQRHALPPWSRMYARADPSQGAKTSYFNSFLVAVSIHSFVYSLCANWNFHGKGSALLPSGVVFTNTLLR